jgi:hypothetical protein
MLDIHAIHLTAPDEQKLKERCASESNQIKYKEAMAILCVNRDLNIDGTPVRYDQGIWVL